MGMGQTGTIRRAWIASLLVSLGMYAIPGCTVRGTGPVNIDHSSPKTLLRDFHAAAAATNYAGMLACMVPAEQGKYDADLIAHKEYTDKLARLVNVIDRKIGEQEAEAFRRQVYSRTQGVPSPLDHAVENGRINWDRVRINIKDDEAMVFISGRTGYSAICRKTDELWYITRDYDGGMGVGDSESEVFRAILADCARRLGRVSRDIEAGRINKANFKERFDPGFPGG